MIDPNLYARNIRVPQIGEEGQKRLKEAHVAIVGAGGLGSAAAYYLCAAGIGRMTLVDSDHVEKSNLQRQILHSFRDLGRPKVESAAESLLALNPDLALRPIRMRLDSRNAREHIREADVVIDASDNFPVRFDLNEACVREGKPMIHAGVMELKGQMMTISPGKGPCYRCVFQFCPENSPSEGPPGILGSIAGLFGCLEATEAVKIILGIGTPFIGRMLVFDGIRGVFREVSIPRNPDCPVCGSL